MNTLLEMQNAGLSPRLLKEDYLPIVLNSLEALEIAHTWGFEMVALSDKGFWLFINQFDRTGRKLSAADYLMIKNHEGAMYKHEIETRFYGNPLND